MADPNTMSEKLIAEFIENYMEKVFYFCLKKTGNRMEAETLAQDIALNILAAINKGTIPASFSAWVWRIARNRYSVWADNKHRNAESVAGNDIGDYEIEDMSESTLDKMIRGEQLALLRRELAFIRREYREIIISYYIENRSIRDIATPLSLSESAVKQRLYRARNILKEGMNMAREFGIRSYKPEEMTYSVGVVHPGGKNQPISIMNHLLYENILLEAYGNPSTAEELSLELGMALPYMENELEYLTSETFLIKRDGKYQTSFPIISRSAQERIRTAQLTAVPGITRALMNFVDRLNDAFKAQGYAYYGRYQDYENAKWTLLMLAYEYFKHRSPGFGDVTKRPDDGQWDMVGYQRCQEAKPPFVGNQAHSGKNYVFQQFRYEFNGIADRTSDYLTDAEARVLYDAVTGRMEEGDFETAAELTEKGFLCKKGDIYEPTILILKTEEINCTVKNMDGSTLSELTDLAENAKRKLEDLYQNISETVCSDLPAVFSKDTYQCKRAVSECYSARGYIIEEALRQSYLPSIENISRIIGAHMDLV